MHNVMCGKHGEICMLGRQEEHHMQISGTLDSGSSLYWLAPDNESRLCTSCSAGKEFSRCSEGMGVYVEEGKNNV